MESQVCLSLVLLVWFRLVRPHQRHCQVAPFHLNLWWSRCLRELVGATLRRPFSKKALGGGQNWSNLAAPLAMVAHTFAALPCVATSSLVRACLAATSLARRPAQSLPRISVSSWLSAAPSARWALVCRRVWLKTLTLCEAMSLQRPACGRRTPMAVGAPPLHA